MSKINSFVVNKVAALQARQHVADEEGQGLAEYGLILALIAVVCVGALTLLGTSLNGKIGEVTSGL